MNEDEPDRLYEDEPDRLPFDFHEFFWRYWPWPIRVLVMIACTSFAIATYAVARLQTDVTEHAHADEVRSATADKALCNRVQHLRDRVNTDAFVLYELAIETHRRDLISVLKYLRRTDCVRATRDPNHYKAPRELPFVDALRKGLPNT